MSISIVIVTYNSSNNVRQLLSSLKNSLSKKSLQLIFVDNNSDDKKVLLNVINKYSKEFKNVKVLMRKTNYGFGVSCNFGAKFAKNGFILFLNPDTKVGRRSLSVLLEHMIRLKADISGGKSILFNGSKVHRTVFKIPKIKTMLYEFSNIGKIFGIDGRFYLDQDKIINDQFVEGVGGAYMLVRKGIFQKLGGFDPKIFMYLEDVDLCKRANLLGMKITYCPHSVIRHIGGASSKNKYKIHHEAWYQSREYYVRKHFPLYMSVSIIFLYKVEKMLLIFRSKFIK